MDGNSKVENVPLAFLLVTVAGLSTTIGAAFVFSNTLFNLVNKEILGAALGFSGGVMFYISMTEIFTESIAEFAACNCLWEKNEEDEAPAYILGTLCFFIGVLITYFLDFLVHLVLERTGNGVHSMRDIPNMLDRDRVNTVDERESVQKKEDEATEFCLKDVSKEGFLKKKVEVNGSDIKEESFEDNKKLERMGMLTALAIGVHNFPEGLATFAATLVDPKVGVALAVAIALHNIPEGLCVAVPIYYATGSRMKGFLYAFFSGVSEIVGALLGYIFLQSILGAATFGVLFGVVGGMMITIVLKELLPTAHRFDPNDKYVTKSVFFGAGVMALSLILFLL